LVGQKKDGGAVEPGEHQGLHTQPALLRGLVGSFDDPAEEATLGGGEEHRGSLLQPRFQAEAAGSHRRGTKTQKISGKEVGVEELRASAGG